ncbi:MAG: hypothetical protein JNL70_27465 [Saprospiraceae bacterium]|nr:hypothetical protein [Saprospiraceae bacterium]
MHLSKNNFWVLLITFTIAACGKNKDTTGSNRVLATVYSRSLQLSDLDGMFPDNATKTDSQQVINAFCDRWIREQIIMSEAERHIPKDLNLEELVKKYRESLILSSYEEYLTKMSLDTTITDSEMTAFYEKNKVQYQLETPIARCYFLKVPKPTPQSDSLSKWWNSPKSGDNLTKLKIYARANAKAYILEDSVWTRVDKIAEMLPKGTLSPDNISSGKELTMKDDDFQYYFRALGVMNKQEIAPLSFIREQASKFILHQRKIQLLEKKKQEMYDAELQKNNIKIYSY